MFYSEMTYVRDYYVFGAAYPLPGDWSLMVYVRSDSPSRAKIIEALDSSPHADRKTDLTVTYGIDPRLHGRVEP